MADVLEMLIRVYANGRKKVVYKERKDWSRLHELLSLQQIVKEQGMRYHVGKWYHVQIIPAINAMVLRIYKNGLVGKPDEIGYPQEPDPILMEIDVLSLLCGKLKEMGVNDSVSVRNVQK